MRSHALLLLSVVGAIQFAVHAQDSVFTYQGRLTEGPAAADGAHVFEFRVFDVETGGSPLGEAFVSDGVAVSNGLFTVRVDLGTNGVGLDPRWLEISVRTNDAAAAWSLLSPRQRITAAPLALAAGQAAFAELAGSANAVAIGSVTSEGIAPGSVVAAHLAPDQVVRSLNGLRDDLVIEGGTNAVVSTAAGKLTLHHSGWGLTGNAGTSAGEQFVGTSDDQPLELRVNNVRALRLETFASGGAVNVLAGYGGNEVLSGIQGLTIAGGGADYGPGLDWRHRLLSAFSTIGGGMANSILTNAAYSTIAGGLTNRIAGWADRSFIGGGAQNSIGDEALFSTIAAGYLNRIGLGSHSSVIGGGNENLIDAEARFGTIAGGGGNIIADTAFTGTIGGGGLNRIGSGSQRSTIAGGRGNLIGAASPHATIGGGYTNVIGLAAEGATIPGGISNRVEGAFGFAAGRLAEARHSGAFVWADASGAPFGSEAPNEVAFRATGGMRVVTAVDVSGAAIAGVELPAGGGAWATLSDRKAKTDFEPVDTREMLERVVALPIQRWRYRAEVPEAEHVGPTAQDFRAAFGLGSGDRTIVTVDADGVALAALQGLYELVREQREQIRVLEDKVEQLNRGLRDGEGSAR